MQVHDRADLAAARPSRRRRVAILGAAVTVVTVSLLATVDAGAVARPSGAGAPTPGSGIGTSAALNNPECTTGEAHGAYGQLNSTTVGGGPVCVKPWKDGDNNGGATAQGVTKTSIKVVAVVPNQTQLDKLRQTGGATATRRADRGESTWVDAFHDLLLAQMVHYETSGSRHRGQGCDIQR